MSLRDRLETMQARPRMICRGCRLEESLSPEDRKALQEAMASEMAGSLIAQALRDEGYEISDQTLQRHRRGRCAGL